jgi:cell division protein FtsL
MRFITTTSIFLALSSAFLLYGLNYDTRQLEARVAQEELAVAKARSDIAVLKAERAYLTRPERIEPLARAQGLAAATDKQFARDIPMIVGSVSK